ncbi:C-X-C motif chemokine 16 isoform X2 [Notamacropus eugenii]|uniref:C-X-C motif chemokine 16 isoform X2 n=1 Tax=Notamacropus eugenii TaxID=9315 RepID=UPI003B66E857
MPGSSEVAVAGHRSMSGFCTVSLVLFLKLIQGVIGNQGSIAGSCPCDSKLPDSPSPALWQLLTTNLQGYESCHKYIRFHLPRKTLCSSFKNTWGQRLRTCFDNHECGIAKTYKSGYQGTQDNYLTTTIQSLTGLNRLLPFTTTEPSSQTNQSTNTQSREMGNRYLNDTTSAPLENSSMANMKGEAKKGQMDQMGTSATIPILCLLGIVFGLTGVLAYVWCRKQEPPKRNPKGFELIIPCETDPPDSLIETMLQPFENSKATILQ